MGTINFVSDLIFGLYRILVVKLGFLPAFDAVRALT